MWEGYAEETVSELSSDLKGSASEPVEDFFAVASYTIDTRPLCQGMPFVLTDAAHPRFILKEGSQFLVLSLNGDIPACNNLGYGYYRYDTRHLSQWEISLSDIPLSLLSSDFTKGYSGQLIYTNPQTPQLSQQQIVIQRQLILHDNLYEELELQNFSMNTVDLELKIAFQSDFADMFEVRGLNFPSRGERMLPSKGKRGASIFLAYKGLDDLLVETIIEFMGTEPFSIEDGQATFHFTIPGRESKKLETAIYTRTGNRFSIAPDTKSSIAEISHRSDRRYEDWVSRSSRIVTDDIVVNLCLERAWRDLYILRQPSPRGEGLAAGIPWYSAIFGRDSAITALQVLPFLPELARECIQVLAAYQGENRETFRAEYPGKIMHELRIGELARTGRIPHNPYYGTADATQLWIVLLAEYVQWTGDLQLARSFIDKVRAGFDWIEKASLDGFVAYMRESSQGLENQGWKDSGDSVMHENGQLATPPIRLCEVQGYTYMAMVAFSKIATLLEDSAWSKELREKAKILREKFINSYWMEDQNFLGMALDADGNLTRVLASNAGHCLWSGIVSGEKAQKIADRLMSDGLSTHWGIRTLAADGVSYNPISYHNGSIWPHDNSIIAAGLRRMGRIDDLHKIMSGIFQIARTQRDYRLPELICGFDVDESLLPVEYPVSCSPQAWAAGSIFHLLAACVNFKPEAANQTLRIVEPSLPAWLTRVKLYKLRVGAAEVDLEFTNDSGNTYTRVLRKSGRIKVIVEG